MSCHHQIIISNLKSPQTVDYSIIIIKGFVENICQHQNIYLNYETLQHTICKGKFSILTELKPGENNLTIKYCNTSINVIINYQLRRSKFWVQPLYIICHGHDGHFQAPETENSTVQSALKRITLGTKLIQSLIAEKIYENKNIRKTFQMKDECKVFHSKVNVLQAQKMSQEDLWKSIGNEIVSSNVDHREMKFLGFLSCTKYCGDQYKDHFNHDDIIKITQGYVALGGGNLALFGTACLYTWPENLSEVNQRFENCTIVNRKHFMDDSCYRGTLGSCFSTTLGSVLHELSHTFDLGHTKDGIMGRGFDDIYKVFILRESEQIDSSFKQKKQKDIFWTESCLNILFYHKWFNNYQNDKNCLKFDQNTKFISSQKGIRVVEIRNIGNEMVVNCWIFGGAVLKYFFQLPNEEIKLDHYVIFVEDNVGNIFKKCIK